MAEPDYKTWWRSYYETTALDAQLRFAITREPLEEIYSCDPLDRDRASVGKPRGLWYAFGKEWIEWCLEEGGVRFLGSYVYAVTVDPAKVLTLSTLSELYEFTREYATSIYTLLSLPSRGRADDEFCRVIDWDRVAQTYSGVEVSPYHWEARLDPKTFWYYSWDVASGCIWEPSAVTSFELLAECSVTKPERDHSAHMLM